MSYDTPAKIGNKYINLKILKSDSEKNTGYQNGIEPNEEEGLLFVFDKEEPRAFHMRNVSFDLDMLGFDSLGRLMFVIPMHSNSEQTYKTLPCQYVIETKKGWANDLPIGACHLKIDKTLLEASVVHSIMSRLSDRAEDINLDSPANFTTSYGWLDLDKDGILDTYEVGWEKFNPIDMKKNAPFFKKNGAKTKK